MRLRVALAILGFLAVIVAIVVAAHDAVASYAIRTIAARMGYQVQTERLRLTPTSLSLVQPDIRNAHGEPVFRADRVDIAFSLRDLLPGSTHRFGLHAVDLERPLLTLIHNADGSYNVALPGAGGASRPDKTPLDVRLRVRDGRVELIDRFVVPNHERREALAGLTIDAILAPTDPAYYRVDATLLDGTRRYPIAGRGRFDHARAFAAQHWWAREIPIGPLVNFALTTHAAHIADGRLRDVDARLYGFIARDGTTDTHGGVSAQLVDGKVFAQQLAVPIRDAHGPLVVNASGLQTTGIDATLAGVPLRLVGAVYDVSHPTLRFALTGSGPLAQLKTIARAAAKRPLSGDVRLAMRIDGPLSKPLVRASFTSSRFVYDRYALRDVAGTIAFSGTAFDVVDVAARYGAIALRGGGALDLGRHVQTDLVVGVAGPSDGVPYANLVLPNAALDGVIVLAGTDAKLGAHGALFGSGRGGTLEAPFDVAPDGIGTIGPVTLHRSDGASVYARLDLDRPHGGVVGVVAVHRLSLRTARRAAPGLAGLPLADLRGSLDGDLALDVRGSSLADAAGALHVRGAGLGALALGDADARLAGDGTNLGITDVHVRGPIADLDGEGAYDGATFAARGRLRSDFARLHPFLHGIPATGTIAVPLRLVATKTEKVLQIDGARFGGARVRGIPLRAASATVALRGDAVDIPGARLDVAGGTIAARGSFGNGGTLALSASRTDLAALGGASLPLHGGALSALAEIGGTRAAPRGTLAFALRDGRFANAPLDATAFARYEQGRIALDDAIATLAGATAVANGTVSGVGPKAHAPRVDLVAQLHGADVATLARVAHVKLPSPDASVDASLRVAGPLADPNVAGAARIPVGAINGLAFRDVVVPIHGTLRALTISNGRAVVGSTTLHFEAAESGGRTHLALAAPHVDLADFNDYFDTAGTLAGRGSLAASLTIGGNALATSGDVALADTRIRRLPIGDVRAAWSSRGRAIDARASVGGAHGILTASGTAIVPARNPAQRLAASNLDVQARIAGLDLGTWLPAFGFQAPVTGYIDGTAHVRGVAPHLALSGDASMRNGIVAHVPIRRLTVSASAAGDRARITRAELEALNLSATGSGSFGLAADDPISVALHATSPDIGAFASQATGKALPLGGALDGTLRVGGTRRAPTLATAVTVAYPRVQNLTANAAHLDAAFAARRLTLNDASVDLGGGRLALSGSVPALLQPPFIDRRDAPISARILAQHVDLAALAPAFPQGTKLGGFLDGDARVGGILSYPSLTGTIALTQGTYSSSLLASPVQNGTIDLAFAGHSVTLSKLHADIGGGALDGSGAASVGDLRAIAQTLAFHVTTTEKKLGIDVPKLFRSKVEGNLDVSRSAGAPVLVAGNLDFTQARLSAAALIPHGGAAAKPPPIPVAFNLGVTAGRDDRVQGPNIDVGATGSARLGGTLAAPTLAGAFTSTDGTLSFYRTFVLQNARVAFSPSNGIIPFVNATATTHIPDPSTDVLLHVHGPATQLALDLASRPDYDRAQILGLLVNAQALGAVSGVAPTSPSPGGNQNLVQSLALGQVNQELTRTIFQPFSSNLGNVVGLSTFQFAPDLTGGYTVNATRRVGQYITTSFGQQQTSTGQRQSFGISGNFPNATSVQLTFFSAGTTTPSFGGSTTPSAAVTSPMSLQLQALAPPPGSNGFVFSYVKRFWVGGPPVPTAQQIQHESAPGKPVAQRLAGGR